MEFRSFVAGSLAEQAERLVDADTEGAGDDALRLLNDDPRLERRLELGYALKEKGVRVAQSLLRRTQERVLALIEVEKQRVHLLPDYVFPPSKYALRDSICRRMGLPTHPQDPVLRGKAGDYYGLTAAA